MPSEGSYLLPWGDVAALLRTVCALSRNEKAISAETKHAMALENELGRRDSKLCKPIA